MSLDSVHNYYERHVFNHIMDHYADKLDIEEVSDMACMALNRLPPKYIRYDIDMSFFMTPEQYLHVEEAVAKACKKAFKKIIQLRDLHDIRRLQQNTNT